MSKAEVYLRQWWNRGAYTAPVRRRVLLDDVRHYGDLRAQEATAIALSNPMFEMAREEEREKVLAELRSEIAEEHFVDSTIEYVKEDAVLRAVGESIRIAKHEGRDETKAELEALKGRLDDTLKLLDQAQAERDHAVDAAKIELFHEWRATDVEKWLMQELSIRSKDWEHMPTYREALARARVQGAEKANAELHEVQSLIHRPNAHATTCAVHGSRACDCGAMP